VNNGNDSVLVVDDAGEIVVFCVNLLQSLGYRVKGASTGAAALEMIEREAFGTVVVDYCMPEMDGFQVMKEARRRSPDTSFVLLTGYGSAGLVERATSAGFAAVLLKPFTRDDLRRAMEQAAARVTA
jgi:CheY-like chemotaxis protein